MQAQDQLSQTFAALANPTRRAILAQLATGGEASVQDLAKPFEMTLPAISKHLKVLEHAGLITRGRDAQWRPCKINAAPLREVSAWTEQYKRHWQERLDRLDDYVQKLHKQAKEAEHDRRHKRQNH